jgi:hypothetical protein
MFLLYIATGIANMVVSGRSTGGAEIASTLANIAQHETMIRLSVLLTCLTFAIAVSLAVALYALTRDQDRDIALLALCFRATEGVIAAVAAVRTLGLLFLATASTGLNATDAAAANGVAVMILKQGDATGTIGAICFAVGSALYCYLFLRARIVPMYLAGFGVVASLLLVAVLPVQLLGFLRGTITYLVWMPMLVFELVFAFWLLIKGVAPSPRRGSPNVDDSAWRA